MQLSARRGHGIPRLDGDRNGKNDETKSPAGVQGEGTLAPIRGEKTHLELVKQFYHVEELSNLYSYPLSSMILK